MRKLRTALLASSFLLPALLSCDVQDSPETELHARVGICPRLAASDSVVPVTDFVKARLQASNGFDTTVTARYVRGGPIVLGSVPRGTAFTISMIGCDTVGNGGADTLNVWWTSASDSASGNLLQHTVQLPPIRRQAPPVPAGPSVSGSFYIASQVRFGPNTYFTSDGSDPRVSSRRRIASAPLPIDSSWSVVKAAVFSPADSTHPDMWSDVATFPVGFDPLDTMATLDSLEFFHGWRHNLFGKTMLVRVEHAFERDSLSPWIPTERTSDSFFVVFKPSSPRAAVYLNESLATASDTIYVGSFDPNKDFPKIRFELSVRNNRWSRTYSPTIQSNTTAGEPEMSLASIAVSPGILTRQNDTVFSVQDLDASVDSLTVQVSRMSASESTMVRVRDSLIGMASSLTVPIRSNVDSILVQSSARVNSARRTYRIFVFRKPAANDSTDTLGFLDTTWNVPWRAVRYDTISDARDGRTYRTIVVGSARWMAENLNFRVDSSWCPASNADSCKKYGRLYAWSAAMDTSARFDSATLAPVAKRRGICPEGWHVPNNTEWSSLFAAASQIRPASILRAVGPVWSDSAGLDSIGMRILPAGKRIRYAQAPYASLTERNLATQFWSATESTLSAFKASSWRLTSAQAPTRTEYDKLEAHSVRCVSDTAVVAP